MSKPQARITPGRLRFGIAGRIMRHLPSYPRRHLLGLAPRHFGARVSFGDLLRFVEAGGPATSFVLDTSDTAGVLRRFPALADVTVRKVCLGPEQPPARLYTRPGVPPRGALVWTHGGAFVSGTLDANEANWVARTLAAHGHPVLTVGYRKAIGGVRYPLPGNDVMVGWRWAVANAHDVFGVPSWRLHLGGASVGGTLVASVVRRLLDDGLPHPASVLLAYPLLHSRLFPWDPAELAVVRRTAGDLYLSPDVIADACLHYAGPDHLTEPQAFPGEAPVHKNHPPTLVLTCEHDSLRTSGELFVTRLRAAGVTTAHYRIPDARHACLARPATPQAEQAVQQLDSWLDRV